MLLFVLGNFFEILSDQDLDGLLVPILWNVLGKQVLLELSVQEVLDERSDIGFLHSSVLWPVLGHILLQLDQPHSGDILLLHAEEFQDPLVVFLVGVNGDEQDLALVVLSDLSGHLLLGLVIVRLVAQEQEQVVLDGAGEDLLSRFVVELDNQRHGVGLDELGDGLSLVLAVEFVFCPRRTS